MSRILIVSEDVAAATRWESAGRKADFEVTRRAWSQWKSKSPANRNADIILFDYRNPRSLPRETIEILETKVKEQYPQVPLVFVSHVGPGLQEMIQAAIGDKNITFAEEASLDTANKIAKLVTRIIALHDAG